MSKNYFDDSNKFKKEKKKHLILILNIIFLFIIINIITTFLIYPVRQNSISMSPDYSEQSIIMVSPIAKKVNRGDVFLLKEKVPNEANFIQKTVDYVVQFFTAKQISFIKHDDDILSKPQLRRVVGLPGDTIYMRDYVTYVKPAGEKHFLTEFEISKKTYDVTFYVPPAQWDSSIGVKGSFDEIVLGPDEYFVLSDYRKSSMDSRLWGPVKSENFMAKLLFCYFPFENLRK